jgi:hypothetical protein
MEDEIDGEKRNLFKILVGKPYMLMGEIGWDGMVWYELD